MKLKKLLFLSLFLSLFFVGNGVEAVTECETAGGICSIFSNMTCESRHLLGKEDMVTTNLSCNNSAASCCMPKVATPAITAPVTTPTTPTTTPVTTPVTAPTINTPTTNTPTVNPPVTANANACSDLEYLGRDGNCYPKENLNIENGNLCSDIEYLGLDGNCYPRENLNIVNENNNTFPGVPSGGAQTAKCGNGFYEKGNVCFPTQTGLPSPENGVVQILSNLFSWLMGLFTILSLAAFTVSGIQYVISAGDSGLAETAKKNAVNSIIGIAVGLSGFIIVRAINAALTGQGFFF